MPLKQRTRHLHYKQTPDIKIIPSSSRKNIKKGRQEILSFMGALHLKQRREELRNALPLNFYRPTYKKVTSERTSYNPSTFF